MEGDQMKMRETLLVVKDALVTISAHEDDIEFVRTWIRQMKGAVQEALAAPSRQCDIGTPEEQAERFARYCGTEVCKRKRCKTRPKALVIDSCALCWAQTPYEAQEGGAHGVQSTP